MARGQTSVWQIHRESLSKGRIVKLSIEQDGVPLRFADFIDLLRSSAPFRRVWIRQLADAPFRAFRWETPPVTLGLIGRTFECVLIDSPDLTDTADLRPFKALFGKHPQQAVITFPNLGGDAWLVAPYPAAPAQAYPHLAAFARLAPEAQQHALWIAVAAALESRLGSQPVWLSSAGGGVAWLHIRLDSQPKYYCYRDYVGVSKGTRG